ncbi:glucitol operon activator protein [Escherichia coli]|uniref:Glucitol operon activator protein n=1 Tax=Escherichia coli TaxID=562 RepID=A0A376MH04_ECOLX|nr:glucitol operon activator protein [Escherichia coli]
MPDALRSSGIQDFRHYIKEKLWYPHSSRRRYRLVCATGLGGWQISRFNRAFDTLCQQGRVGVAVPAGALNRGSWSPSPWTISNGIVDTLFMKGLTVFARPQKIPAITGMYAGDLQPDVIFPHDPLSQNALSLALKLKRG